MNPGITYGQNFELWDAAIAAGAGLDDLVRLDSSVYSREFQAKLLAFAQGKRLIDLHRHDAVETAREAAARRK